MWYNRPRIPPWRLQVLSLEHELEDALQKKSSLDPTVRDMRAALRTAYLEIIFRNFKLARVRPARPRRPQRARIA